MHLIPGEDLTMYIARARTIQSDLTLAGQTTPDPEVVLAVLSGLPQPYAGVVTVLMATEKQMTLEGILPTLLPVQQKLDAKVLAYGARASNRQNSAGRKHIMCHYCGKLGHYERKCFTKERDHKTIRQVAY